MWLAFMLMLTIFHHPKAKAFCLASFLALTKQKDASEMASLISFSCKKARQTNIFCLRMVKNCQHKDKLHTRENFQDAAISVKEVIKLFRGVNLSGVYRTFPIALESTSNTSPRIINNPNLLPCRSGYGLVPGSQKGFNLPQI